MTQQPLFEPELEGVKLTDRQRFALSVLACYREGLTPNELGAFLHERKDKHAAWQRCDWCFQDGHGVLKALRSKELAIKRRGQPWTLTKVGRGVVDLDVTSSGLLPAEGRVLNRHSAHPPVGTADPTADVALVRPSPRFPELDPSTMPFPEGF